MTFKLTQKRKPDRTRMSGSNNDFVAI